MYKDPQDMNAAVRRYQKSPKGRATINRYRNLPHVKKKLKKYAKEYRLKNLERTRLKDQRNNHLAHYGEPFEEKARRLERQGGRCANPGCGLTDPGAKGWQTDHDHKTGKVRGELCGGCNKALGFIHDDPIRAEGLATYVRQHK